ncbi:MAG: DUF4390 domain-containing protein [Deltaproteobacteria bacterium]|nr:DUF4390 domain-containing protein [Deltaproteobacteria bacterium]
MAAPNTARLWLVFSFLFVLAWPGLARADSPHIERVVLTSADDYLKVNFRLVGAFLQDQVNQTLMAGLPTTFTYRAELLQVNALLPAKSLALVELNRTIRYDPLPEQFSVTTEGQPSRTETVDDLTLAQYLMSEVSGLKVAPMSALKKGQTYRLRIWAVIHGPKVPSALKPLFYFGPPNIES